MGANVATTQWSQVLAARDGSDTEARRALEGLCQTYWQPLYAYIRHQGSDPDEASDLIQAFFAELLGTGFLADGDPSKERFRSFLLATLRRFLAHERDRGWAMKQGGGSPTLSLDVESGEWSYASRPVEKMSPEDIFERRWALRVLDRALDRLRLEAESSGDGTQVEQLEQYLTGAEPQVPYRKAGEALGMSAGAVAKAVHRLRERYGQCLRAEIVELVVDPAEVDDELRHMLKVVWPLRRGRQP